MDVFGSWVMGEESGSGLVVGTVVGLLGFGGTETLLYVALGGMGFDLGEVGSIWVFGQNDLRPQRLEVSIPLE